MTLPPDTLFAGRFRIERELGRGGYGTVYLAHELGSGDVFASAGGATPTIELRAVALKVLAAHGVDQHRFPVEIRAMCRLNHPNIVQAFTFGTDPQPWVAMQLVDGRPLAERARPNTHAEIQRTLRVLVAVADALAHAHAQGVVHRDLKPHNILVDRDDVPHVVDFGLSWLVNPDDPGTQRVGTAGYIAPERLEEHGHSDHRADIYGLGATIHAAFAGRSPFWAETDHGVLRRQVEGRPVIDPAVPAALRPLIADCVALDPADRPPSAARVAEQLRRAAANLAAQALDLDADERVDVLHAQLRSIESFSNASRGDGLKLEVQRFGLDGDGPDALCRLFVYAGSAGSTSSGIFASLVGLTPGTGLSFFGARRIRRAESDDVFSLDDASSVVVEPSMVLPVTTVARVEGVRAAPCPTRVLVDLREPRTPTVPIVTGSLLHAMLEQVVHYAIDPDDATAFDRVFDEAVRGTRIDLLAAGVDDGGVAELRAKLQPQFERLVRWTKPGGVVRRGAFSETARLSARYGLDGRIDLVLEDDAVVRVVELKSGKRESADHELQIRAYALMLDGLAAPTGRRVEPWLLYSQLDKARQVTRHDDAQERNLLLARNAAFRAHQWLADRRPSPPPEPLQFRALCDDEPCRFRRSDCVRQAAVLGSHSGDPSTFRTPAKGCWAGASPDLIAAARAYYFHFAQLVEREHLAAVRSLGRVLRDPLDRGRIDDDGTICGARIAEVDARRSRVLLECDPGSRVSPDDLVYVHRGDFDGAPILTGSVRSVGERSIEIATSAAESAAAAPRDGWYVDRSVSRGAFRDMHRALYHFVSSGRNALIDAIVRPPAATAAVVPSGALKGLNAQQASAVLLGLGDHPIALIQGPPGTGKTAVIAELCARLTESGQRVLIAAFTNAAVDTALARVVRHGVDRVLRIGSAAKLNRELSDTLADFAIPAERVCSGDLEHAASSQAQLRARLLEARVVAATTNACAGSAALEIASAGQLFDVVIVDEAAQLVEPLAVAALLRAKRAILVGDHRQLPPVIRAAENLSSIVDVQARTLVEAGVAGLDRSLFERLSGRVPGVMLVVQYRMNSGVQEFPSRSFYDGRLEADASGASRRFAVDAERLAQLDDELRRRLDPDRAAVWVDVGGAAIGNTHPTEAAEVARTVAAIARTGSGSLRDRVGVVSPYRAQCEAIRAALRESLGTVAETIEVDTVDRFQGREKEAIVISLVSPEWNEFVMDPRRINVMLTRARTKVVVFGPRAVGRRMVETFAGAAG